MSTKKIKIFLFIGLISFAVLNFILFNNAVAQTGGRTIELPNPLSCGQDNGLYCIIQNIISKLAQLAIPIVVIMVLIGGFQIMTAGGNEEKVKQGRLTIWWAVIGYVIILLANGLVLIIKSVLGAK
jgi:exosome complex RNA-binding protein Rrp42 (RNase PH superfamily)